MQVYIEVAEFLEHDLTHDSQTG